MSKPKKPAKRNKAGTSKRSADEKKKLFAAAYLSNNGNLTQAALAAGYSAGGAPKAGYRLSKDPFVLSLIGQGQKEILEKYRLTADDVYRSIAQELHFHPAKLYHPDGSLKRITELDDDTAMALTGIEVQETGGKDDPVITHKLKWNTKNQAREQLIKLLNMYSEKPPDPDEGKQVARDLVESARAIAFTLARAAKLVSKK